MITSDAIVIGGGFYGAAIAIYLAKTRGLKRVILLEKEKEIMMRASYHNQARVHNGYHYPRSFTTAFRSRVNFPRFVREWQYAVKRDFLKIYAIARNNSKVTSKQFERFCHEIGAKIQPADNELKRIFSSRLIQEVFLVEEYAFDSTKIAEWASLELEASGVEIHYSTRALSISYSPDEKNLKIETQVDKKDNLIINSRFVFNCTYSGLNQFLGDFPEIRIGLKHEVTEMALIKVPDQLKDLGVTVMDGPFFSLMPFPARGLHTLSHVRYTPHINWRDVQGIDPYKHLSDYNQITRADRMIRDAGRYLPSILKSEYFESLFEIKTVLLKNEIDDGRPILFEKHLELPGCYSILGGKIDNIYDVLERMDYEFIN